MKSRMARVGREVKVELEYFRWRGRDRMKARKGGGERKRRQKANYLRDTKSC
jgi:hypothetical protein